MADFVCDIVTPAAKLASEEVELVVVPGVKGSMGFMRGHAPLVSVLADGVVRLKAEGTGEEKRYALQGGYVQVDGHKVIILADRAVLSTDIDVDAVKEQLEAVEAKIAELSTDELDKTTLRDEKAWCEVQLKVAEAA